MRKASPLLIAQITDTHLFASSQEELLGLQTDSSFKAVLREIQALTPQPQGLLLTGDLSQDETLASYQNLYQQLEPLQIPAYWLPGNHDQPQLMQEALTKPPTYGDKSFQLGSWQFILLNSAVPGRVYGYLSSETLEWLDKQLYNNSHAPTLVALHHPPFSVNSHWIDTSRLKNPEDLFRVLDCHPQVNLVVFGHIHQNFQRDRAGVRYLASPSSSIQFKPECDRFALDELQPGYRLFWLYENGEFATTVKRVEFSYTVDLAATGY
ncbi:3',5'-cyclic-AMP phosphodiesterase [Euhalothece natronophila Z-M001]|uniref:3',5'-cyclic-AMP phosphodiesterase n=1 Tax=Euhalothece natronophila Z-M001 TaxID=522448 RepID=A0A5B8NNU5_9CHRO|nr:3',5'-cyclic-AMP phosphodiesterase [Euhalothece natronophila]QDZ39865.1 3',5'-cyclic-AMP phosphodiesterase [Euhalothece natronophila Z-M001]